VIEIDYRDPVVQRMVAVNEAANASYAESMERISAEHGKAMDAGLKEHEEQLKQAEAAYATERRPRQPEDPHRWPGRDRKNRVLNLSGDEERPTPPLPPPPVRKAEPPKPKAPDRPRRDHVLTFSADEEEGEGFRGFSRRR
jgi:hypothetical protein